MSELSFRELARRCQRNVKGVSVLFLLCLYMYSGLHYISRFCPPLDQTRPLAAHRASLIVRVLGCLGEVIISPCVSCAASQKPMTTDQALDSLSSGFTTATQPKPKVRLFRLGCSSFLFSTTAKHHLLFFPLLMQEEGREVGISASSAGPAHFAPPPVKVSGKSGRRHRRR